MTDDSKAVTPVSHSTRKRQKYRPSLMEAAQQEGRTIIYTDGSYRNHGTKQNPKVTAGIGVWFGRDDPRNVSLSVPGLIDNYEAELYAIFVGLQQCKPEEKVLILTDSRAAATIGKRNSRCSKALIQQLLALQKGRDVQCEWIPGHSGIEGNRHADRLAKRARKEAVPEVQLPQSKRARLETVPAVISAPVPVNAPPSWLSTLKALCDGDPIAEQVWKAWAKDPGFLSNAQTHGVCTPSTNPPSHECLQ